MEYFGINKSTLIAIYGLGNIGKQKCEDLLNCDYHIISFIDQAAENMLPYCGIEVWTPDRFSQLFPNKEEIVIIVCLNNALQHEKAVHLLSLYGYKKFLYIPMDDEMEYEYLIEMQQAYSLFEDNRYFELKKIPLYEKRKSEKQGENINIISDSGEHIIFLCGIESLFSANLQQIEVGTVRRSFYEKVKKNQIYVDKPIVSLEPYKNLYEYMMGKISYPDLYLEYLGKDKEYNRKLLADRVELFKCYEKRYNRDIRLFYTQPATVIWNEEKKYFNVCDGMHRLMYLYYVKSQFRVPVKTIKESFDKYKRIDKKENYIYKSPELVLQELLFPWHFSSNGAVIMEDDVDIERLFRWGNCTFYNHIGELSSSRKYDWIFLKVNSGNIREALGALAGYSSNIILECADEVLDESVYINNYKLVNIGETLADNLKRKIYYLLERGN